MGFRKARTRESAHGAPAPGERYRFHKAPEEMVAPPYSAREERKEIAGRPWVFVDAVPWAVGRMLAISSICGQGPVVGKAVVDNSEEEEKEEVGCFLCGGEEGCGCGPVVGLERAAQEAREREVAGKVTVGDVGAKGIKKAMLRRSLLPGPSPPDVFEGQLVRKVVGDEERARDKAREKAGSSRKGESGGKNRGDDAGKGRRDSTGKGKGEGAGKANGERTENERGDSGRKDDVRVNSGFGKVRKGLEKTEKGETRKKEKVEKLEKNKAGKVIAKADKSAKASKGAAGKAEFKVKVKKERDTVKTVSWKRVGALQRKVHDELVRGEKVADCRLRELRGRSKALEARNQREIERFHAQEAAIVSQRAALKSAEDALVASRAQQKANFLEARDELRADEKAAEVGKVSATQSRLANERRLDGIEKDAKEEEEKVKAAACALAAKKHAVLPSELAMVDVEGGPVVDLSSGGAAGVNSLPQASKEVAESGNAPQLSSEVRKRDSAGDLVRSPSLKLTLKVGRPSTRDGASQPDSAVTAADVLCEPTGGPEIPMAWARGVKRPASEACSSKEERLSQAPRTGVTSGAVLEASTSRPGAVGVRLPPRVLLTGEDLVPRSPAVPSSGAAAVADGVVRVKAKVGRVHAKKSMGKSKLAPSEKTKPAN